MHRSTDSRVRRHGRSSSGSRPPAGDDSRFAGEWKSAGSTGRARVSGGPAEGSPGGVFVKLKSAVLHLLSHHERLLLVLWYVEQMSPAEVALTLDVTEQQVFRMHSDVLSKLRLAA